MNTFFETSCLAKKNKFKKNLYLGQKCQEQKNCSETRKKAMVMMMVLHRIPFAAGVVGAWNGPPTLGGNKQMVSDPRDQELRSLHFWQLRDCSTFFVLRFCLFSLHKSSNFAFFTEENLRNFVSKLEIILIRKKSLESGKLVYSYENLSDNNWIFFLKKYLSKISTFS